MNDYFLIILKKQEIITRDSVTVSVDAVCYFRTFNAVYSILKVENAHYATHLLGK